MPMDCGEAHKPDTWADETEPQPAPNSQWASLCRKLKVQNPRIFNESMKNTSLATLELRTQLSEPMQA